MSILAVGGAAGIALTVGLAGGPGGLGGPDDARGSALQPFDTCDELLDYAREHRWARNAYPYPAGGDVVFQASAAGAMEDSALRAAAPESGAVGPGETGTNVQEAGIDEPDIAKLSGATLFRVQGKAVRSYDVSGDSAVLLDEIDLEDQDGDRQPMMFESQLLIAGDRAVVISGGYEGRSGMETTTVTELDVSDPSAMSAVRVLELEGANVSGRLQGSTMRLVVESRPDFPGLGSAPALPQPQEDGDAPSGATGETGPEPKPDGEPGWLPRATLYDIETGEKTTAPITGCGGVSFPDEFSGLGLLSVLTIDLQSGIEPTDVDTVMTDGSTVYASPTSLFVAGLTMTPPPSEGIIESIGRSIGPDSMTVPPQPSGDTAIHRFDTSDPAETDYAASGEVPGTLIGQFAMSESEGVLRVASTTPEIFGGDATTRSQSFVTVLEESEGRLEEIGQVGGLGLDEDIYAVRFIGEMGYVVTFEQTDPLYTVDLSDPENPVTTGELKIPGYSAYLHPVADGKLLGIGQAGTADGTITGAQASLFDVGDASEPERLDALDLSDGRYSSASTEWDHHAFLYSPEHSLAVVPVESNGRGGLHGAIAMTVDPEAGLSEVARLEDEGQIERMLIAGENLVTVSARSVSVRPVDAL